MEKLFQKIKIDDFDIIQQELISQVPEEKLNPEWPGVQSWIVNGDIFLSKCPTLAKFINARLLKKITQVKFYVSPVGRGIGHHTDGASVRQPFGLALPIQNTRNTSLNWYKEDIDNFKLRRLSKEPLHSSFQSDVREYYTPIDPSKLEFLGSLELTGPTFTRSDLMHNVDNNSGSIRAAVLIRWPQFYTEIEQVFDTTGILID